MSEKKTDYIQKLLNPSYNKLSIYEYEAAIELINRAFHKICLKDNEFYNKYSYLKYVEGENTFDKMIEIITEYYLEGRSSKKVVMEEFFPIIHVLNGCKNTKEVEEFKKVLLRIYA